MILKITSQAWLMKSQVRTSSSKLKIWKLIRIWKILAKLMGIHLRYPLQTNIKCLISSHRALVNSLKSLQAKFYTLKNQEKHSTKEIATIIMWFKLQILSRFQLWKNLQWAKVLWIFKKATRSYLRPIKITMASIMLLASLSPWILSTKSMS